MGEAMPDRSFGDGLDAAIDAAMKDLATAREERRQLDERIATLDAFIRASLRLAGREVPVAQVPMLRERVPPLWQLVATHLRAEGRAMMPCDIAKALKRGGVYDAKYAATSIGVAMLRRPDIFERVAPGRYQLKLQIEAPGRPEAGTEGAPT